MVAGFSEKAIPKASLRGDRSTPMLGGIIYWGSCFETSYRREKSQDWILTALKGTGGHRGNFSAKQQKIVKKSFHYDNYRISQGHRDSNVFVKRSATKS